jgi:hypothetical protein
VVERGTAFVRTVTFAANGWNIAISGSIAPAQV